VRSEIARRLLPWAAPALTRHSPIRASPFRENDVGAISSHIRVMARPVPEQP
jgi:hypothetical protein